MKKRVITGIIFIAITSGFIIPGYLTPLLPLLFFFLVTIISLIEISTVLRYKLPNFSQAAAVIGSLGILIPIIPVIIHGDLGWRFIRDVHVSSPNRLLIERTSILKYVTESTNYLVIFFILFTFISVIYMIASRGPSQLLESVLTPLTAVYVVFPMSCAIMLLYIFPNGYLWIIAAILVAWISDVFAFFAGVTLGKHKIVPSISPKKTWEGTIGGILGSIFIMVIWMGVFMNGPDIVSKSTVYLLSSGVVIGLVGSIVSQLGDWFASAIKRLTGVKDFGNVLPGHGGIVDRFDGVFFTFPTMLAFALIYYLI